MSVKSRRSQICNGGSKHGLWLQTIIGPDWETVSFMLNRKRTPHSVGFILLFVCLLFLTYVRKMTLKWD